MAEKERGELKRQVNILKLSLKGVRECQRRWNARGLSRERWRGGGGKEAWKAGEKRRDRERSLRHEELVFSSSSFSVWCARS